MTSAGVSTLLHPVRFKGAPEIGVMELGCPQRAPKGDGDGMAAA